MRVFNTRLLSLLLAVLLLFGLTTATYAVEEPAETPVVTEAVAPMETPEPSAEPTPTAEPTSEVTTAPVPTENSEPTPEPTPSPTPTPTLPTLSAGMVDTLYPAELLMPDPYGIALLAQGGIPDAMWDNSILRALAYTGFNVQKLKDNGWLYAAQYISGQLKTNAPDVLSGIGYNETGSPPGGDEMTAGSSVTGKVPNIAHFRANGMVCATFVSYYLTNYLPNIEGVDTSAIYSTAKSKGGLAAVRTWRLALGELASTPGSGVTKYTTASTAYANLVPGDIIVFNDDIHIAVYLGEYDLMSYGSSRGRYHFIAHVGNSRGPEISTAEYMADSTYKPSSPVEWYHLEFASEPDPGIAKIKKTTNTGANLGGWQFNIYSNSACTSLVSGSPFTTDSSGEVNVELAPGDYWVKEIAGSNAYWASDTSTKKVTVQSNQTATVTFKNTHYGRFTIQKSMPDGGSVSGWEFKIYRKSDNTLMGTVVTDAQGKAYSEMLLPGDYLVQETIPEGSLYVSESANPTTVTVSGGKNTTVNITNRIRPGAIHIQKTDTAGAAKSGAEFLLEWSADGKTWKPVTAATAVTVGGCTSANLTGGRLTSGADGKITFTGLYPNLQYRLTETKAPNGYSMLTEAAYIGSLPADDLTLELTVVNCPIYTLPHTGSTGAVMQALAQTACALIFIMTTKRKKDLKHEI